MHTHIVLDDSGSMDTYDEDDSDVNRQQMLRQLVARMSGIATRLAPYDEGVHLRFINKEESFAGEFDSLTRDQMDKALDFEPDGLTPIGTELRKRILNPFVIDIIEQDKPLQRPILVIILTDGFPSDDDPNELRNAIIDCGKALLKKGYEPQGEFRIFRPRLKA